MRDAFSFFQSPIDLAHHFWARLVSPGDSVIDATCGNGKDTLALAHLVLKNGQGKVIGLDIQEDALEKTKRLLAESLPVSDLERVLLLHASHEVLPDIPAKLIVYNLGYLPGGDKSITTKTETTLKSIRCACTRVVPGGAISITCYPGHAEGKVEASKILDFLAELSPSEWSISQHQWPYRGEAPFLVWIQRAKNH